MRSPGDLERAYIVLFLHWSGVGHAASGRTAARPVRPPPAPPPRGQPIEPWNDASGIKWRQWLGATEARFYDRRTIARPAAEAPTWDLAKILALSRILLVHPSCRNFRRQAKLLGELPKGTVEHPWFETGVPVCRALVVDAVSDGPQDAASDRPPKGYS
jgi:hypothetical protein